MIDKTAIERKFCKLIEELNLEITIDDVKRMIWEEEDLKDYQNLMLAFAGKVADIKRANEICEIVSEAWNNFPHKSLDGLSPTEKIAELNKNDDGK